MLTRAPKGTKDLLPTEAYIWQYIEATIKDICKNYGYREIRTPIFEHTELFQRGVGETTDVVSKEMYTFDDKKGRSITLRAEGTAPTARAFIENKLYADPQPTKFFYIAPVFRYEKPQKGRLRQHHQFGIEIFGSDKPSADAEVMSIVSTLYNKLGIKGVELHINSIGCPECRKRYNKILSDYLSDKIEHLCQTCNSRYEKNPMRILDCKNEECQELIKDAPLAIDNLCEKCIEHFEGVKEYLGSINIDYIVNPKIVRGLDYYTRTAFEFISSDIGAKDTVCGGGRYDGLVEMLGGPSTPAVGFGMGIERLILTLESNDVVIPNNNDIDIFIVTIGDKAKDEAFKLSYKLRNNGISSDMDHLGRSTKAQFKYADKTGANFTVVIGDDEIEKDVVSLKNMKTGEQNEIQLSNILETIQEKLGR